MTDAIKGLRNIVKLTAHEGHARGCHCMPVTDDDGELVFTSKDDRCERFREQARAALLAWEKRVPLRELDAARYEIMRTRSQAIGWGDCMSLVDVDSALDAIDEHVLGGDK